MNKLKFKDMDTLLDFDKQFPSLRWIHRLPIKSQKTLNRNDPCSCGSGRKYKHCCLSILSSEKKTETQNDLAAPP